MKKLFAALALLFASGTADAFEYTLQFPVLSATVVGYSFLDTGGVSGAASYSIRRCTSGRGARCITTHYDYTVTWDFFGNITSTVAGAPVVPAVLYVDGTKTVYADDYTHTTGADSALVGAHKGFVTTPSSHYEWQTPNGQSAVIPFAPYTFTASLLSDGDFDLNIAAVLADAAPNGTLTPVPGIGTATVSANDCGNVVSPGVLCSISVTYDPTGIVCTPSPYGYAYIKITLPLMTDAPFNVGFTQVYTMTGVPYCDAEEFSPPDPTD